MFSDLIISQAKALGVMFCSGVLVEIFWQIKKYAKHRVIDCLFWAGAFATISMFMYYGSFGKVTLYSVAGFFAGLLLWKKICCGIINNVWVENEEGAAENLKTTARSSIPIRPESRGWKKGRRRKGAKKRR